MAKDDYIPIIVDGDRNSGNWLSHDLVECFIWLGIRLYDYMGTFLQREMEPSYL